MAASGDEVVLFTGGVPNRLTGGNLYNRHLCACLEEAGRRATVVTDPPRDYPRLIIVDSIALASAFSWIAGRPAGTSAVALMHMLPSLHARSSRERLPLRRVEMAFLRCVDLVVAASRDLAAWLQRLDVPAERIRVVRPGKDGPQPAPRSSAPAGPPDPGHGTGTLHLLCVANWSPVKRLEVLVRAMAQLPEGIGLNLVGDPAADPGYAERVLAEIQALNVAARISVDGPVPPEHVGAKYARADVFVLPSAHEGYATAVAEALWFGLPVVATAVGGIPDLVTPGIEGLLVPPDHTSSLARALRRVCDDSALRTRLAAAAAARGADLPTWQDTRGALRDLLLPLLE